MTDPKEQTDRLFVQQASALLQERADGLDARTRSRLNRARQAALNELDNDPMPALGIGKAFIDRHKFWAPAGGLVIASIFAAVVWVGGLQTGSQNMQGTMPSAIEMNAGLLTVDEDFELLAEMEFYNWLQSVPGGSA
jgi:hypothetical protein